MSTPIKNGGPAFPYAFEHDGHADISGFAPGMALRDWFAGQAIALFPPIKKDLNEMRCGFAKPDHTYVALFCYQLADAMIAARDRKEGSK